MTHISQEYGSLCSKLVLTNDEYQALKDFLTPLGVELRVTVYHGATGIYEVQARNELRDICKVFGDQPAGRALAQADKNIKEGLWRR